MNSNNKNLILAFALAVAVYFTWNYFVATPAMKAVYMRLKTN